MIICIDIGNTNIKYALFEGNDFIISFRVSTEQKKLQTNMADNL